MTKEMRIVMMRNRIDQLNFNLCAKDRYAGKYNKLRCPPILRKRGTQDQAI